MCIKGLERLRKSSAVCSIAIRRLLITSSIYHVIVHGNEQNHTGFDKSSKRHLLE